MKHHFIFLSVCLFCTSVSPQQRSSIAKFEIGGSANYLMPRQDYQYSWGPGLNLSWNLSGRYGLNLSISSTNLDALKGDSSKTVNIVTGNFYFLFHRWGSLIGFTSIGMAGLSDSDDAFFIFSGGMKIPIRYKLLLRLEIKDYYPQIGIPFFTFPGSRVDLRVQGLSRYLELSLGISYTIGEIRYKHPRRRGR